MDLFIAQLSSKLCAMLIMEENGEELASKSKRTFFVGMPGRCLESRGGAGRERRDGGRAGGREGGRRSRARGCGAPLARLERRRLRLSAAAAEQRREPAEPSGGSPLPRNYRARQRRGIGTGALAAAGKDGRSGGARRQAPASRQAPQKPRHANPFRGSYSREEQTLRPAFVENPNPKDAEIFNCEKKTIKNSQIIENIS